MRICVLLLFLVSVVGGRLAGEDGPVFDEYVGLIHAEPLSYPVLAGQARIQGDVVIRVNLDETGSVVSTAAISGARIFIPGCLTNAKKWRFEPKARKTVFVVYEFRIAGNCEPPCGSQFTYYPPNRALITVGAANFQP